MPARPTCLSLLACLALLPSLLAPAAAPPAGKAARVDRYGDPLPPGAKARLGTVRWRYAHPRHYPRLRFSPDGRVLVVTGDSGLLLWDVATGRPLGWAPAGADRVNDAAFSADGKVLLTARPADEPGRPPPDQNRRLVQRWQAGTGKLLGEVTITEDGPLQGHPALSADGRLLLAPGTPPRGATLWDTASGRLLLRLDRHLFLAVFYSLAADARALAVVEPGAQLRLYDLGTGKRRWQRKVEGEHLFLPALSADGKALAVSARDESSASEGRWRLYLYDARSGKRRGAVPGCYGPAAFSPGGKYLACGDRHAVRLFEAATLKEVRRFAGSVGQAQSLAFSDDGKLLAAGGQHVVDVWDVATGRRRNDLPAHRGAVSCLRFSPDGRRLASGADDGLALLWDVSTQRVAHSFAGHGRAVVSLAFSPDGNTLATGDGQLRFGMDSREAQVRLWDLTGGRLRRQWSGHLHAVRDLAFSPDARLLATAGGDDRARLWEAATGRRLRQVRNVANCLSVGFSRDGKTVLVHGSAGDLFLWEVATGKKVLPFREFQGDYRRGLVLARWLADGRRVAGAGPGGLRFWDGTTGKELRAVTVPAHPSGADAFALSPDGKTFAAREGSGGGDAVGLWDTDTGECFARLRGHTGSVSALAFSPDSGTLASGGYDTTVLLWDVPRARLLGLWLRLAGEPGEAKSAARRLAADPPGCVPFLAERLTRAAALVAPYAGLIAELDSDDFAVRERASRRLEAEARDAEFALRLALEGSPSAEVRGRARRALRKVDGPREERVLKLVAELDGAGAAEASRQLQALGRAAAPALRRLLEVPPGGRRGRRWLPPRARWFVQEALRRLKEPDTSTVPLEPQGVLRAVGVLGRIGTPEARRVLEGLAGGPAGSPLTREAARALGRLKGRGGP
jgi:WD40 repeat protein